jgi:hypothetical protein
MVLDIFIISDYFVAALIVNFGELGAQGSYEVVL